MATLKLTIFKARSLKDGRHKIRIAVCHKQKTCYIVTRFIIDNISQFKNGQVVKRQDASIINTKLRNLLNEYQDRIDNIKSIQMYDCKQLKNILMNSASISQKDATFQAVSTTYINELIEDGRENYAKLLERNCRYFTEFTKGELLLSDITPEIISNYDRFLRNTKKVGDTTIGMMMSHTRIIINRGIKKQLVKYNISPFTYYSIKSSPVREVDITIDNLIKIKNCILKEKKFRVAQDLFMLSSYLGGIIIAKTKRATFKNETSKTSLFSLPFFSCAFDRLNIN